MEQAKVTSKGQVTIPKGTREKLNIHPGDKLSFKENSKGEIVIESDKKPASRLAGILYRQGQKKITIEEMNEAIKKAAVERYNRSL